MTDCRACLLPNDSLVSWDNELSVALLSVFPVTSFSSFVSLPNFRVITRCEMLEKLPLQRFMSLGKQRNYHLSLISVYVDLKG